MEKPILFNTKMVQAILSGRKTQTRRIIKIPDGFEFLTSDKDGYVFAEHKLCPKCYKQIKPPCKIGDILWVRETWANTWTPDGQEGYVYKADGEPARFPYWGNEKQCKDEVWIPPIHMPRKAARIFLKVTKVKVERLQEIGLEGIRAEGCLPDYICGGERKVLQDDYFKPLWNGMYNNWDENPWVWVISFERVI